MTNYNPGDVILVAVPFTNHIGSKKRASVVVSTKSYNDNNPDLIVLPITSQTHEPSSYVEFRIAKWSAAGLLTPSFGKPLLASVEKKDCFKNFREFCKRRLGGPQKNFA